MKWLALILLTLSFNSVATELSPEQEEKYKTCVETCLAYEEPGFALRKCVSLCKKKYVDGINKFCTSFEDFCDDDDDDVWGGL